jgi:hypothetical protein
MKKAKSEQTQAATTESTEPEAPTELPVDSAIEELAKNAYAIVAEELKFKGDFPAWDHISDRARALYVEGAAHVQAGGSPRTRFEEVVVEVLKG